MPLDIIVCITGEWQSFHRRLPIETLASLCDTDDRVIILNRPVEPLTLLRRPFKFKQILNPLQTLAERLYVFTPRLWLHDQLAYRWLWSEDLQLSSLRSQLLPILRPEAKKVLWLMHPCFFNLTRLTNWDYLLYDCYDEFIDHGPAVHRLIPLFEERLFRAADTVITAAPAVAESKRKNYGVSSLLIPNPTRYSLFTPVRKKQVPVASELAQIPEPRVGYIGGIKSSLDQALLRNLATQLPQVSFVLIGALEAQTDLRSLTALPNVYWLGYKPADQLPTYLSGFHTGLIPYQLDAFTRNINPNKAMEYLMAGLEVVSTPIPALKGKFSEHIHLSETPQAFLTHLQVCLSRQPRVLDDQILYENSWEYELSQLLKVIKQRLGYASASVSVSDNPLEQH